MLGLKLNHVSKRATGALGAVLWLATKGLELELQVMDQFTISKYRESVISAPVSFLSLSSIFSQNMVDDLSSWWHHDIEMVSALLAICGGNRPVTGGFPSPRASKMDFDDIFDVGVNTLSNKQ